MHGIHVCAYVLLVTGTTVVVADEEEMMKDVEARSPLF
jgi:hypothetical protein